MLVDKNYHQIIEEFVAPKNMPNWKVQLIKDSNLLATHCKSKYIAIPKDNSHCYLLKSQRPREINNSFKIE